MHLQGADIYYVSMESMQRPRTKSSVFVFLIFTFGATVLADDVHHHSQPPQTVGNVSFPISCSQRAQSQVEQGLARMHSFLFDAAEDRFKAAVREDSSCAMAYWAQAIGLYRPLVYAPSDADMKQAWAFIQKAQTLKPATQRERDYVAAAAVLFTPDERSFDERSHEYAAAMEKIYSKYPKDREAAVFYALSLLTSTDSKDPIANSEKAIAILNPVFHENPDNPGVAHYLIHAADSPRLAHAGLEAARRYARIASASPHALHMPSHIFARLGLWREDIRSNLESLKAAQNPTGVYVGAENQLHAMEFLEYAYLQIGDDKRAKEMMEAQARVDLAQVDKNLQDYVNHTRANSPALYYLETRNWKAAEALQPDLNAEPYNQAITHWARAIAAGHLHDIATAEDAVNRYDALLEATKTGPRPERAKHMTTRRDEAHAWLYVLQGKDQEAIALLQALADKQDAEGKGEIELPAREMLADVLLEINRPSEALAEYEKSLSVDPNRFNGLYGAGRVAQLLGQSEKQRKYYSQLLKSCAANSRRPELTIARAGTARAKPLKKRP